MAAQARTEKTIVASRLPDSTPESLGCVPFRAGRRLVGKNALTDQERLEPASPSNIRIRRRRYLHRRRSVEASLGKTGRLEQHNVLVIRGRIS